MNGPRRSYRSKMRPFTFNAITKQSTDEHLTAEIVNNIRPNNVCIQVQTTKHLQLLCTPVKLLFAASWIVAGGANTHQPKRTKAIQNING